MKCIDARIDIDMYSIYICTIPIHFSWHRHLYGYLRQENGTIRNTMFEFVWWIALWDTNQTGFSENRSRIDVFTINFLHFYGISHSFPCLPGWFSHIVWQILQPLREPNRVPAIWFSAAFCHRAPVVLVVVLHSNTLPFAIENGHFLVDFAMNNWWFSTAMSVYQRVLIITRHVLVPLILAIAKTGEVVNNPSRNRSDPKIMCPQVYIVMASHMSSRILPVKLSYHIGP